MERMSPLQAALFYHSIGLRVVLLHNLKIDKTCSCGKPECNQSGGAGKHPRRSGWNKPGHGMLETADDIKDAWNKCSRANIGVITGGSQFSNLICLDVDPKHGGNESLATLIAKHQPLPPTWQATTGSGGAHYLFAHPGPDYTVRNSQADDKKHHPKLGPGLDIKGDRGQFVVYPSVNAAGKYVWVNGPDGPVPLAPLPDWLRDLIAEKAGSIVRRRGNSSKSAPTSRTTASHTLSQSHQTRIESWASQAVKAECDRVLNAAPGAGNDILNQAAFNLGQIVGGGSLAEDVARSALFDAATEGGRRSPEEAGKTIHSGLESGKKSPRTPPEREDGGNGGRTGKSRSSSPTTASHSTTGDPDSPSDITEHPDDPHRLANAFIEQFGQFEGKQRLWKWRDEWYNWNHITKCYREIPKSELKDQLNGFVKKKFDIAAEEEGKKPRKVTAEVVNNTIAALGSMCLLRTSAIQSMPAWLGTGDAPKYIPLTNGLLDYSTISTAEKAEDVLHPHTPEWFSVDCLAASFDPAATCPKWLAFLHHNLEGDAERIAILQEWFGYCITHDTSFQKFMILNGEGANGKSVICAALIALLGIDNVSTVPLELFGERFQTTSTLGKLGNISADVGEIDRAAEGQLKSFISGDMMYFDRKGMSPINAYPTARLMIATNTLPHFNDKSSGIWRRVLLLPLNVTISEDARVPGMDKAKWWAEQGEISGILNWAIVGRERLYANGRFTSSDVSKQKLLEYREDVNPTLEFCNTELNYSEGSWTETADIYNAYKKWCEQNGHKKPMGNRKFGKELTRWITDANKSHQDTMIQRTQTRKKWGYSNVIIATLELLTSD